MFNLTVTHWSLSVAYQRDQELKQGCEMMNENKAFAAQSDALSCFWLFV